MKRFMVLLSLLLMITGCVSNKETIPTPEVEIHVSNESSLLFNKIELNIYQDEHLKVTQGGMYADQSLINNGDSIDFAFFKEDPINLNSQIEAELYFYHNQQQVASRSITIDLSESNEFTVEFNDDQSVVR